MGNRVLGYKLESMPHDLFDEKNANKIGVVNKDSNMIIIAEDCKEYVTDHYDKWDADIIINAIALVILFSSTEEYSSSKAIEDLINSIDCISAAGTRFSIGEFIGVIKALKQTCNIRAAHATNYYF